jgi:hypothetical protein
MVSRATILGLLDRSYEIVPLALHHTGKLMQDIHISRMRFEAAEPPCRRLVLIKPYFARPIQLVELEVSFRRFDSARCSDEVDAGGARRRHHAG